MPKQSREQIIAELNARKVGYSDEMSYNELCELLKQAQDKFTPESSELLKVAHEQTGNPLAPKPKSDEPIDYSNIRCGLSTIQDLHRRITLIERAMKKLSNG